MDPDDELTSDILAALACMPFEKQTEGMVAAISVAMKHMSTCRLLHVRERISIELDENVPAVRTTLELIDGQLALREIASGAHWR